MPGLPAPLRRAWRRAAAPFVLLGLAAALGCEQQQRVPYIPATLHNWEKKSYRGRPGMLLHVFEVGRLGAGEVPGAASGRRHVLAYVLQHPKQGLVVIDTGLNHAVATDKDYLPKELTALTSVELQPDEDLPAQMRKARLDPAKVRRVLLSNLRLTHSGELAAFAAARVSVSKREHEIAAEGPPGYLSAEYEGVKDWDLLDFAAAKPLGTMNAALDLFADGSVMAIAAAGPTEGNVAFLLRLPERPVLLAGDLASSAASLRHAAPPPALRDRDAWWQTIWRVKRFAYLEPRLLALPGYDPEAWRRCGHPAIRVHASLTEEP